MGLFKVIIERPLQMKMSHDGSVLSARIFPLACESNDMCRKIWQEEGTGGQQAVLDRRTSLARCDGCYCGAGIWSVESAMSTVGYVYVSHDNDFALQDFRGLELISEEIRSAISEAGHAYC